MAYEGCEVTAMRNLDMQVQVPADRKIKLDLQLPDEVDPGLARITVIVHGSRGARQDAPSFLGKLTDLHVDQLPGGTTFSRSELYGDDGR